MQPTDDLIRVLGETRDLQRAMLEEQRAFRTELLARDAEARDLQRQAVANQVKALEGQQRGMVLYRRVLGVGAALVLFLMFYLFTVVL